ncbi:MAG TPA: carbohydrate kinase family protein [Anaerolineaceae bacterium]|nr:carbohydrate kinase family protein [Anaerolineaceae bacterium]
MTGIDVLVLGDYFCDLIITGLSDVPRLGADLFGESMEIVPGGAYILTTALHRLGMNVRWRSVLGNDLFSKFVREEAVREGLDTSCFQSLEQPFRSLSVSFSFSHDRGFISYTDPHVNELPFALVEELHPRWVVNAPFDGSPESLRFVDFIHHHGGRVYTDCQYTSSTLAQPGLTEMLSAVDIFAPNVSEARQLTGETELALVAVHLARFCPLVIIKCGGEGAYAQSGNQVWRSPALKVNVVDTTGAGDSFNAGFLAAYLRNEPIETCLRYGNICGGLSVTRRGGASAAPTLQQLEAVLAGFGSIPLQEGQ